jgi:Ca2+-binding EF-hand superfamily protein
MGGKPSRPVIEPADAVKCFRVEEIDDCQKRFHALCLLQASAGRRLGRSAPPAELKKNLSKAFFTAKFLQRYYPSMPDAVLERVFQVVDFKGDKKIDYEEFVSLYYILSRPPEEKFRFLFVMFDTSNNDWVSKKELRAMSSAFLIPARETKEGKHSKQFADTVKAMAPLNKLLFEVAFFTHDRNTNDQLEWTEFRCFAEEDDSLQTFVQNFTLPQQAL